MDPLLGEMIQVQEEMVQVQEERQHNILERLERLEKLERLGRLERLEWLERLRESVPAPSTVSSSSVMNTPAPTDCGGCCGCATNLHFEKDQKVNDTLRSLSSLSAMTIGGEDTCVPEHGGTYVIRDITSKRVMALVGGKLTVIDDIGTRGGWHWYCEENIAGLTGFREAVSGRYLGRDDPGAYVVSQTYMRQWECFMIRPRQLGGYNICVMDTDIGFNHMCIVDSEGQAPKVVVTRRVEEAARWEFIAIV